MTKANSGGRQHFLWLVRRLNSDMHVTIDKIYDSTYTDTIYYVQYTIYIYV